MSALTTTTVAILNNAFLTSISIAHHVLQRFSAPHIPTASLGLSLSSATTSAATRNRALLLTTSARQNGILGRQKSKYFFSPAGAAFVIPSQSCHPINSFTNRNTPVSSSFLHNRYYHNSPLLSSSKFNRLRSTNNDDDDDISIQNMTVFNPEDTPYIKKSKSKSKKKKNPATTTTTTSEKVNTSGRKYPNKKEKKLKKEKKKLFRADKVLSTRTSMPRAKAFALLQARRIQIQEEDNNGDIKISKLQGPKQKISMNAILYLDYGENINKVDEPIPQLPPTLVVYHKPKNVLSAMKSGESSDDVSGTVSQKVHLGMLLPDRLKLNNQDGNNHNSNQESNSRYHPVGRLDYETSGLLLFSSDGALTQRLLHPKFTVEKEYIATVSGGKVNEELLKEQLEVDGVSTKMDGVHFGTLLGVEELTLEESLEIWSDHKEEEEFQQQQQQLQQTSEGKEEDQTEKIVVSTESSKILTNIRMTVSEGKYRMVRRMMANCGHPVLELKRERLGDVYLNDLPVGEFRDCTEHELEWAGSLFKKKGKK